VLDELPKQLQPCAKEMLHQVIDAPGPEIAPEQIALFWAKYGARYPEAVETLTKDHYQSLMLFNFPAEHWIHPRTTNPIASTFPMVKALTKKPEGDGSQKAWAADGLQAPPRH